MSDMHRLFEIADQQQGYFTNAQAVECGFLKSNFHRHLSSGIWIREWRGIYRLAHYPVTNRPELVLWSLWSRDKKGIVQAVWSHETALDIYELSDVMPAKMHMTVPKKFRRQAAIPKILSLHFEDLPREDIRAQQGYLVTTPIKTLLDVVQSNRLSRDLIAQALSESLHRGLVSQEEIKKSSNKLASKKLMEILNDSNI